MGRLSGVEGSILASPAAKCIRSAVCARKWSASSRPPDDRACEARLRFARAARGMTASEELNVDACVESNLLRSELDATALP